jgi:hypothetical protein
VTHVDQVNEARAKKIILFGWAVAVLHGQTKLQGFQCNNAKPCSIKRPKSPLYQLLSMLWGLFKLD